MILYDLIRVTLVVYGRRLERDEYATGKLAVPIANKSYRLFCTFLVPESSQLHSSGWPKVIINKKVKPCRMYVEYDYRKAKFPTAPRGEWIGNMFGAHRLGCLILHVATALLQNGFLDAFYVKHPMWFSEA